MAMNRVQFRPGMSLPAFLERYGTEALCEAAVAKLRWPRGFVCERCRHAVAREFRRSGSVYHECVGCGYQASLRAGTVMGQSKLPLRTWLLAMYLLAQSKTNLSALELKRHLGVSYPAAWRMKHKLMQAMLEDESGRKLGQVVQLDDAYLGGERNGGKRGGRGSENKRPFVAAVQTTENGRPLYVALDPVPGFTRKAMADWFARRLVPGSDVYSDGLAAFRSAEADCAHTVVVVKGRQGCEAEHLRWVNVMLSNLKRALDVYHAFKFKKYAGRYLGEAAWRFNHRFHLDRLVGQLLAAAVQHNPISEASLRAVPVYRTEGSC